MKKIYSILLASALGCGAAGAVTPMWLRDVKISPDGKDIAFTYKGDIWKVPVAGGTAVRLTSQPSYESEPVWSPDGKSIAFASDRTGGTDIYIMSSNGGSATRLTTNSAAETPEAFTPDGKYVLFSASIQDPAESALFPYRAMTELYRVPVAGGRVTQVLGTPAVQMTFLPDGSSFIYEDVKGGEDKWRKHHTSSVTRDIWKYDAKTGKHTNLTKRGGEDRNPVVSKDGSTIYFLSERNGGSFNVYSMPIAEPTKITKVTDFKTHPVRFLSQGNDGTFAFTYNGEIYTKKGDAAPVKVKIDLNMDEEELPVNLAVRSMPGATVSPDGNQIAFVNRGEIFVTSTKHPSTKQITHTPAGESNVAWAPDNRTLYYTSERDGHYNIYKATISRKDDPNFSNATVIEETPMFNTKEAIDRTYPSISPDGKKMTFVQDRTKLMVMDLDTKKVRQLTDGSTIASRTKGFPSQWSPDSKWILIEAMDLRHQPYGDIAIINAETGKMTYVTKTGYFDENPRWAMDGNAIIFASERYGMRNHASWGSMSDVMITFLNQDTYDRFRLNEEDYALLKEVEKAQKKDKGNDKKDADKKGKDAKAADDNKDSKDIKVELEGLADRTIRLTPNSSNLGDAYLTPDGETLYYLSAFEKGYDLWKVKPRTGDVKLVSKLSGVRGIDVDKDGNLYLVGASVRKFDPKTEKTTNVSASASMKVDGIAEREYMLKHVFNEERERFFRTDMNGANWSALYENYKKFLPHINNNYDFAELLSELLGELNVSHTGGRYYAPGASEATASLGLLYDWNYDGDGLKVAEVLAGGPFDRASSKVKAGAVVKAINGVNIDKNSDYTEMFNNLAGKKTLVTFTAPGQDSWEEVILPISSG
ncbi:MAG: DPP IV N-terminal domain-containing protein, partial [Paramuribaculum sp.]|nr:DPP IV N-terminal domain-containing protein [Paramuribaculum sp.]